MVRVRRLGHAASSTTGVLDEHRACRERGGRVRRVAPRHRSSARRGRVRRAAVGAHQRSRPDRARRARSTRTSSTPTTRTSSTTSSCGGSTPSDFLVMPNASNTAPLVDALRRRRIGTADGMRRRRRHRRRAPCSRCRARDARELLATSRADAAAVPRFDVAPVAWREHRVRRRHRLHRRGRRRARTCRRRAAAECGTRCSTPGITPAGLGRPRHAAARSRPAAARPRARARASRRCRPGWAGSCAGTRATSAAGRRSRPRSERGVARRLAAWCSTDGSRRARGTPVLRRRTRAIGEVTSGNFSPMLGRGIALAFVPPDVDGATRSSSTCAAGPRAIVTKLPFVPR